RSLFPVGALAAKMCFVLSVNVGASEAGAMICTDGRADTHVSPVIVCAVGFPAASLKVTVRLEAPAPGHGMFRHEAALTAAIAMQVGVAAEPTVTQKLAGFAPSVLVAAAASVDVV